MAAESPRRAIACSFLSAPNFDPAAIDTATVRVAGVVPVKFVRTKDYNKDGIKDLAAFVGPRSLGLVSGAISVGLSAALTDGGRVAGRARVSVK